MNMLFKGYTMFDMEKDNKNACFREIILWIETVVFAVLISLLIRGFIFETVLVDGSSMENTLCSGDRLILYKLGYHFKAPKTGDIIVLQVHEGALKYFPFLKNLPFVKKAIPDVDEVDYIKRVVAVPGDTIEFKDGYVYVNGKKLDEPYVKGVTNGPYTSIKVGENKVFVLGDNRSNSRDSREIGLIDFDKIRGKAVFRVWPFSEVGSVYPEPVKAMDAG